MLKIGVVEDEAILLEDLKKNIDWTSMGGEIIWGARNGKAAIKKIYEDKPDILITDIKMPIMGGIDLLQYIRQEEIDLQVIFLTGYEEIEYMKIAIEKEVIGYILKPFDEEEIRQVIEKTKQRIDTNQKAKMGQVIYKMN